MSRLTTEEAIRNLIREALTEQPQPTTATATKPTGNASKPATLQKQIQQPATAQQKNQKDVQDAVNVALSDIASKLPSILKNFADSDKDGKVEYGTFSDKTVPTRQQKQQVTKQPQQASAIKQQQEQVQESKITFEEGKFQENLGLNEAGLVGLVASAPAILSVGGKLLGKLGKKVNAQWLQNIGGKVANAGHTLHNSYIGVFEKALTPFMKGASKEQIHTTAEALFMVIVGTMLAQGVTSPDILTGVKGRELASYVTKSLPKLLPSMGFA
jgi:DNA mismatch repair ATPase MutL